MINPLLKSAMRFSEKYSEFKWEIWLSPTCADHKILYLVTVELDRKTYYLHRSVEDLVFKLG